MSNRSRAYLTLGLALVVVLGLGYLAWQYEHPGQAAAPAVASTDTPAVQPAPTASTPPAQPDVSPAAASPAPGAASRWVEGTNYVVLDPAQPPTVPAGKVEVMEVFSYGCPACNSFQPVIHELERSLPRNAQMVFLPASFKPNEDWPMFQQAYFAAQALGIAARTHQAIFDAVWKTGELATFAPSTNQVKNPLPSIEDAARCYSRLTGVSVQTFLAAAQSFGVATKMREADEQIMAMQVPGTPCIVVAGKYRILMESLNSPEDVISLVKYLVAKAGRAQSPRANRAALPLTGSQTSAS